MPGAEVILWSHLKSKALGGYKFRRQYGIDRYVVDFYSPKVKLVIEIDGDYHFTDEAEEYDRQREAFIQSLGISIIRFTNLDVRRNMNGVIQVIRKALSPPYEGGVDTEGAGEVKSCRVNPSVPPNGGTPPLRKGRKVEVTAS